MGKVVGRIIEVKGLQVKAKLHDLLPPYLIENGNRESAPKINGFVKTKIGIDTIICQVVGEYSEEIVAMLEISGQKVNLIIIVMIKFIISRIILFIYLF